MDRLREDKKFGRLVKMRTVRTLVGNILEEILDNNVRIFVSLPVKSTSGHEYQHAIDTTLLSILLAREFDFSPKDMTELGTAALLHDIGKLIFVDSPDQDEETKESFKELLFTEHPTYSRLLLEGSEQYSYTEQLIVHQHHERLDGNGFPQGLRSINKPPSFHTTNKWAQIHKHALILAVANHYDNLLSGTEDGIHHTPKQALTIMIDQAGSAWNSHVIKALGNVVRRYPVGCPIIIKDNTSKTYIGYVGVVLENDMAEPDKPEVILTHNSLGAAINPIMFDLNKEEFVQIDLDI
jgi:HD-GYP domain-containing protein (c-di-GMP phosphodiesterase class II)